MTRWSRRCSCRRIHSMPSTLREANLVAVPTPGPKIKECEGNCFEIKPYEHQWQPISCRRRIFGRVTSPIGGELPDFNAVPLLTEQEIDDSTDLIGLASLAPNLRRPFQLIPALSLRRIRPSWSQFLKLLLGIVFLVLLILALKRKSTPESSAENPSMIERYRREIETLKHDFPGQSGWLWFIIDTLALDLIGQPAYQSDDQIRSVVFAVPQNSGFSGWCLAWELTKVINRIGSSLVHPPANFSFADIYCLDDCRRSKKPNNNIARSDHEKKMSDARNILWEEYMAEDRLNKLIAEASQSGQAALFINHLQAAPRAGLDLLIRPRRRLNRHKSGPLDSLRLIFYMVHLPAAGKSQVWTVSKVRDYIVSLWPDLEPEVELLLKTRLVGHVVLVRPF